MEKDKKHIFEKLFAGIGFGGSSKVPLRSNVFNNGGSGYNRIGQTGRNIFSERTSPLLGNAQPSNRLSGYFERIQELKSYQLLDITKLSIGLFRDYLINFLVKDSQQVCTIQKEDGSNDEKITERINTILTKELRLIDYIENHIDDSIFYGTYTSMLQTDISDTGHLKFRFEELYDPVSVVTKKIKGKDGTLEEAYLTRGTDGVLYEVPRNEAFCMGATNLRLINDLSEGWEDLDKKQPTLSTGSKDENRSKVLRTESYVVGEPLFYTSVLKVKELVIKELLVSLLSLRDLSSPSLFGLAIDKGIPIEAAQDLCARVQKMSTNSVELASFMTGQFDSTSFIESALVQNIKVFPDYNGTLAGKNSLLPLDKLSDKLIEIMQTIDQCRNSVLSPLGIPASIYDSTTGSKWAILQQSERANSKVASLMSGISGSVIKLISSIYRIVYNDEIDTSLIKLHLFEKSTVEYNNQINQSESINSLVQGISNVLQNSLQTLDLAGPLIDSEKYLTYIQNLIKDIDPSAESMISAETISQYIELLNMKIEAQKQQLDM